MVIPRSERVENPLFPNKGGRLGLLRSGLQGKLYLMGHQHRQVHALQDRAGGAAEQQLANPGMPVGTDDQEVGAEIGGAR